MRDAIEVGVARDDREIKLEARRRNPNVVGRNAAAKRFQLPAEVAVNEGRFISDRDDFESSKSRLQTRKFQIGMCGTSYPRPQLSQHDAINHRNIKIPKSRLYLTTADSEIKDGGRIQKTRIHLLGQKGTLAHLGNDLDQGVALFGRQGSPCAVSERLHVPRFTLTHTLEILAHFPIVE